MRQNNSFFSRAAPQGIRRFENRNSARLLGATAPLAAGQEELPLNRFLAKYPRFFWYAAIAILGIIIGSPNFTIKSPF